jgi:hypothetical protein
MCLLKYYDKETKTLSFPPYYNEELKNLPEDVENMIFYENFEEKLFAKFNCSVNNLPNNLQNITFGWYFNKSVDKLPNNLQNITFGYLFNQPVDNLPKNLQSITFGNDFNHPVDYLPPKLKHLKFGTHFNHPVDKLPNNLQSITFGYYFNCPINKLPITIKELGFCSKTIIKNNIPEFISDIKIFFCFDNIYNQQIDNIPYHIEKIMINDKTKVHYLKKIPFGCKVFDLDDNEIIFN